MPRRRRSPQFADLGTRERHQHGDVIISDTMGSRQARVLSIVACAPREAQDAAAWLLALWRNAHFPGIRCQRFEFTPAAMFAADTPPGARAESARRTLAAIGRQLPPQQWRVCWHYLMAEEPQQAVAIRLGISRGRVKPLLLAALVEVARIRR